ncbi:alpha/beta hydrolase [Chitinophaga sancti]|uniref:alpha/beta fold hydrolase n=1 Tax=Chitinophaga sancti TaxID=1004 RepID=UPI002A753D46|nr:alpha/beta hydrolase [Chitinophaga sancti]WPQ62900.1 alpha/beta hydrolase [Chitinophaga sancti]
MPNKLSTQNIHLIEERPVIVLLHGFAENSEIWNVQKAYLSEYFEVIALDLPGVGNNLLTTALTIDSMADNVYTSLQSAGIEKAVIIGHSMGGYVALAIAEKYPSILQGMGLFHSTALADTEEKKEARRKSIKLMEQYGSEAFIRQAFPNMFSPGFKAKHPESVEAYVNMGIACPLASMEAYYEAMITRPDRTAVLSSILVPVLFVIGKDDTAVPLQSVLPQVSLPRTSSIYIFEETGHMGMWEVPSASNQLLHQFTLFCQDQKL